MAQAKKAARKTGAAKKGSDEPGTTTNKPQTQDEVDAVRKGGVLRRDQAGSSPADPDRPHSDRNHESNMVEVESMPFTRVVDGKRYGPSDGPITVPRAIAETFGLTLKGKKAKEPGVAIPASDPANEAPTEEDIAEAAEAKGIDQETLQEKKAEQAAEE